MIKDISIIRKELENYEEVELPFDFQRGGIIKYITLKKKDKEEEEESFYNGGKFINFGNDCVVLKNKSRTWSVPTCKRNKNGSIRYSTRFFIKGVEEVKCDKKVGELNEIIQYQQSIIEKMTHKITGLEVIKQQLSKERQEYEELLQNNRHNLKKISIESREKDDKILKYEEVIKKLANSHQMFHKE